VDWHLNILLSKSRVIEEKMGMRGAARRRRESERIE
jgi:hypothetical protein